MVIAHAQHQLLWRDGVHRLVSVLVRALGVAIGHVGAQVATRKSTPVVVGLQLKTADVHTVQVDGLEGGRVVAIAILARDLHLVLNEVLVAAGKDGCIQAQRIHAATQTQLKGIALLGLEVGVGNAFVERQRVLKKRIDLARIRRPKARRVIAIDRPCVVHLEHGAQLGRDGGVGVADHRRRKARLLGLDAVALGPHARCQAERSVMQLSLRKQRGRCFRRVREALEREALTRWRCNAVLLVDDLAAQIVHAISELAAGIAGPAQSLASLGMQLQRVFVVGHIALAIGQWRRTRFGHKLTRVRALVAGHELDLIGQRRIQLTPLTLPAGAPALHGGLGLRIRHGGRAR